MSDSPWLIRPYEPSDEGGLHYMLGISYTRSRAGKRAGASRAGGSSDGRANKEDESMMAARQLAFLAAHRPIWTWLLAHVDVTLACDPEQPHIVWGWLLTTGDVVHAVGCKRSFCERRDGVDPISIDLVTDMLGERLHRHQVCSLELPQFATRGSGMIGIDRPREWSLDPTWLVTRMGVGLSMRKAA